jgi:hypothetical protein
MTSMTAQKLRFISRPFDRRVALIPLSIAMVIAWAMVPISFWISVAIIFSSPWGFLSALVVAAFAGYLTFLTLGWIRDSQMSFELFIDGDLFKLSSYDQGLKRRVDRSISLRDVETAEYYEPRDVASLLLCGHNKSLAIPLWSFGPEVETTVINYVKDNGVKVVGIPNPV